MGREIERVRVRMEGGWEVKVGGDEGKERKMRRRKKGKKAKRVT